MLAINNKRCFEPNAIHTTRNRLKMGARRYSGHMHQTKLKKKNHFRLLFFCVPLALVRLLSSFFHRQLGLQDSVSEFSLSLTATAFLAHAAKLWIWSHILLTPTITFKFDKPLPDIYVRGEKKILLLAWFHKHDRRWKAKLFSKEPCLNYFPLPVLSLMRRDIFALLSHSICFLSLIIWTLWAPSVG